MSSRAGAAADGAYGAGGRGGGAAERREGTERAEEADRAGPATMRLEVLVPTRIVLHREGIRKVVAESAEGSFGLLPRHIDFVASLVPGILLFEDGRGEERLVAVDRGLLVKTGPEVSVSVRRAVPGEDLETLRRTVRTRFEVVDERERQARAALAELETRFIRRFLEERGERGA